MLQSRIQLMATYLANLPPCEETGGVVLADSIEQYAHLKVAEPVEVRLHVLRSIQALVSRLALVVPWHKPGFTQKVLAQRSDAMTVILLGSMASNIKGMQELIEKSNVGSLLLHAVSALSSPSSSPSRAPLLEIILGCQ